MSQVERNVIRTLCEENRWLPDGMGKTNLIENVGVAIRAVGNDQTSRHNCRPNILNYRTRRKKIISASNKKFHALADRFDMILINGHQILFEGHEDKYIE